MGLTVGQCIHGLGLGGAQKVIASIVRGGSEDIEHIVYSCEDGVLADEVRDAGAQVRVLPRNIPKWDHGWMLRTAAAFLDDGVDVVHGHLFGDTLHGYFAARRANQLPFLMTLHNDYESFSRIQKFGYGYLLRRADLAVGCSRFVEESFAAHHSVNGRLSAIVNGIEAPTADDGAGAALLEELEVDRERPVVMTIGRLSEQKGFRVLLDAFSQMTVDAQLVFVGEGDLEASLRQRRAELGLGDRVFFAGYRDDAGALTYVADVVAFPSLWEGLPIGLIEAMARRRALVVTALPGMLEAVRLDEEALVAPPGDAEALAGSLDRLLGDEELRSRLGRAARARYESCFTAAQMVSEYEAVYRRLAETEGPPS
ncbi:MAG: glycosyltransferase [Acidobacteriota bacterium]